MRNGVQELSTLYTVQGCDVTSDCNYTDPYSWEKDKNRTKGNIDMGKKSKNTQRCEIGMMSLSLCCAAMVFLNPFSHSFYLFLSY